MALTPDQVANEVSNTMSTARAQAQIAIGAALNMTADAVAVLNQYSPSYPTETITVQSTGYSIGSGFDATEKPPSFPTIRTAQDVQMGALGDIDTISATFTAEEPSLNLPSFSYSNPSELAGFSDTAPEIDDSVDMPEAPTFSYPDLPSLLAIGTDVDIADLTIPSTNITMPSYNNVLGDDFYASLTKAQAELPNYDDYGMQLVNRFYPGTVDRLSSLQTRIAQILEGTGTALTDTHDQRYYDALLARIEEEADKAIDALDEATVSTGWDLPGATRAAGRKRIQQEVMAKTAAAAMEVYTKRTDRELQHLQFVMGLVPPLQQAAVSLFGQAWGMQMDAYKSALQFADTASKFSTLVYQLRQRDYELAQSLTDKQIAIFEALLKAELAKADISKLKIEQERLKAEVNQQQVSLYTAQLQGEETKARVYASQIDALRQTIEARKLPLEVFLAKVQGFSAQVQAKKNEYDLLTARITGDRARVDGELAKLQVYKTEADVFGTIVTAQAKRVDGQIQRNQQILEEFKTKMQQELQLTQIDESVAKYSLNAYEAMARVYIAETNQELEQARFDFNKALEDAKLKLEQTRFSYERQFKALEMEMIRNKATADINMAGAQVQASIGSAAMSVMNTMAQLSAETTA